MSEFEKTIKEAIEPKEGKKSYGEVMRERRAKLNEMSAKAYSDIACDRKAFVAMLDTVKETSRSLYVWQLKRDLIPTATVQPLDRYWEWQTGRKRFLKLGAPQSTTSCTHRSLVLEPLIYPTALKKHCRILKILELQFYPTSTFRCNNFAPTIKALVNQGLFAFWSQKYGFLTIAPFRELFCF